MATELHNRIAMGDVLRCTQAREIERLIQAREKRDAQNEALATEVREASKRVGQLE